MAPLHQHARAAERERLLDLLVDHRLGQQVPLALVARAAVEGAEVAVGDADVRVVDVAVDDERDATRVGAAPAQLVRGATDRDQVARLEQREGVGVGDALAVERLLQDGARRWSCGRRHQTGASISPGASAVTKRSSGTWSSSPTSRASSRNVIRPFPLARAEAVAELLEVAGEEPGGIAVARRGLVGERRRVGACGAHRGDERVLELDEARMQRLGRGPHREHHRQTGALEPEPAEVVVRRRVLERRLQRCVADQQRRVGVRAERDVLCLGEEHLRQNDRRGRLGRDRDGADPVERRRGDELDRVDRALGGDAEPRQQEQRVGVARVLDRGDRRGVDLAREQPPVEVGRDADDLLVLDLDPVEDRRHVGVGDAPEPDAHEGPPLPRRGPALGRGRACGPRAWAAPSPAAARSTLDRPPEWPWPKWRFGLPTSRPYAVEAIAEHVTCP